MVKEIVLLVLGVALGRLSWFVERLVRKDHIGEGIQRRTDAAKLAAFMKREGLSDSEVDAALDRVDPARRKLASETVVDSEDEREFAAIENAETQQELNIAQGNRLERLEGRMEKALSELEQLADENERSLLAKTQERWLAYRDSVVAMAGAPWESGSMQPFIEAGEASILTQHRITELEDELARRREWAKSIAGN